MILIIYPYKMIVKYKHFDNLVSFLKLDSI